MDHEGLRKIFKQCQRVVDFRYPSGKVVDIRRNIGLYIRTALSMMEPGTSYIYMSSIMAYGMPADSQAVRLFRIPRNTYSFLKRKAEKEVFSFGKKRGVFVSVFRLGQVHGAIQAVSKEFRSKLSADRVCSNGSVESLANTVFAHEVGDAIVDSDMDKIQNRTVTLVSRPQWTLAMLHGWYQKMYGGSAILDYKGSVSRLKKGPLAWRLFSSSRDLLETYLLLPLPFEMSVIKGWYRVKSVKVDLLQDPADQVPELFHLLGASPDSEGNNLDSTVEKVAENQQKIADLLRFYGKEK